MTPAQLRRSILGALHTLTGTMEPWREVGIVMRRYLGPWMGMSATERWETMGPVELELLADAVTERAAIVASECACGSPASHQDLPRVINRHHHADPRSGKPDRRPPLPEPWVYVGRGTPLGNPFTVQEHGDGALELYREHLQRKIGEKDPAVMQALRSIHDGHHLVCSCAPRPCHAHVIADVWAELRRAEPRSRPCSIHRREVVICGGRDYEPNASDGRWVQFWLSWLAARVVVHGGARGVDWWAGTLGARLGLEVVEVPADWTTHGNAAGPMRNRAIAERLPVAVLALPGGRGTFDMCRVAAELGIPVFLRTEERSANGVPGWAA